MAKQASGKQRVVKSTYIVGIGSFLNVFEPKQVNNQGNPKYSAAILIPKSDKAQLRELKARIDEVALEYFGPSWQKDKKFKYPLQDGDEKFEEDEKYAAYKGHYFVNASNERPVGVLNVDRQVTTSPAECYSGCTIQFLVNFFSFTTMGNGVGTSLQSLRVLHKGKRLDGSVDVTEVEWDDQVPEWAKKQMESEEKAEASDDDEDEGESDSLLA